MTNKQAAQILREHKRLVRGADSFTRAIDKAITALDQPEPDELERFKVDLLRLFPFSPGTNFMAVDSDGELCQFVSKPKDGISYWADDNSPTSLAIIKLPDGIDWRDCLIERH